MDNKSQSGELSNLQTDHFRRTGYLKLPNVLTKEECNNLTKIIFEDIHLKKGPYKLDKDGEIYRLDNLYDRDEEFKKLINNQKIILPLSSLIGPNFVFCKNRHNHATINTVKHNRTRLHRDILQWSRSIVTALVYLENSSEKNGCTNIVPSSHLLPFTKNPNNGGTWMDEHEIFFDLLSQSVPVSMFQGDVLFIDSLMFHATGKNYIEDSQRPIITLGYHSVDELSINMEKDPSKVLVFGNWIYRGNDLPNK